jgi:hypothetical protein
MSGERLAIAVTYDERRGYIASAPELQSPVIALSLGGLRRRVEALMSPDEVIVVLSLDRAARMERDRRRLNGRPRPGFVVGAQEGDTCTVREGGVGEGQPRPSAHGQRQAHGRSAPDGCRAAHDGFRRRATHPRSRMVGERCGVGVGLERARAMNKLPTIEQRIAVALTSTDITSSDLAALIQAVEVAAQVADEDATKARKQALDPGIVVDTAKVGAAVATAELTRDRLQAALPRLRTRYTEVREQEDIAAWKAEADELEPRGVALLDGFAEFYPEMAKRIANHLDDMRAFDKQVDDLNRRRPNGVPALSRSTPALAKDLRIPSPYKTGELWWPPPQQNLALQYLGTVPPDPFIVSEAAKGTYIKERDRRVLEDNRRQIAEAEQRQREFEKQKAAEGMPPT